MMESDRSKRCVLPHEKTVRTKLNARSLIFNSTWKKVTSYKCDDPINVEHITVDRMTVIYMAIMRNMTLHVAPIKRYSISTCYSQYDLCYYMYSY